MALPNEIHPFAIAGGGNQYQVANSLRIRRSVDAYLNRTFGSPTDQKTWTFSGWFKRGYISLGSNQYIMHARDSGNTVTWELFFGTGDTITVRNYNVSSYNQLMTTTQVFRDPSAWYHIVFVLNTSNSTAADRHRLYINGSRVTSFSSETQPSLNMTCVWNTNTYGHGLAGVSVGSSGTDFDGYMAEVNFIDGQALDPSYFGQTDSITGIWGPKKYTGTYGTNGFYLPFNTPITSTYAGSFNGSNQYLQATLPATLTGAFTVEYFLYRGSSGNQFMFTLGDSATSSGLEVYIGSTGTVLNGLWGGSSQITSSGTTTTIPVNDWSHIAITRDASNNIRMFLNGVQVGSTVANSNAINNTLRIGVEYFSAGILGYLNGSLSNFRIINGTCLYTSNYNVPAQALTAISGTSILTLQSSTIVDNSGNALSITNNGTVSMSAATPWTNFLAGQDSSGSGNGWKSSGVSITSGTTYDVMIDSPTAYNDGGNNRGNYSVMNPLDPGTVSAPTNGNLTQTLSGLNGTGASGTFTVTTGKWYWEVVSNATTNAAQYVGLIRGALPSTAGPTTNPSGFYYGSSGNNREDGTTVTYGNTWLNLGVDYVIGVALDCDANSVVFYVNNVSQGTRTLPSTTSGWKPQLGFNSSSGSALMNYNFGQRPFSYTPPAGFLALNTYNLANPSLPLV